MLQPLLLHFRGPEEGRACQEEGQQSDRWPGGRIFTWNSLTAVQLSRLGQNEEATVWSDPVP